MLEMVYVGNRRLIGEVIGISDELQVPVKYIGLGEGIDDLQVFDRQEFVRSLFDNGSAKI